MKLRSGIYFDYNATTPLAPPVREAILKAMAEAWGNPGSAHEAGLKARKVLELARKDVAELIKARQEEIIFTSGGTESNNLAS